MTPAVDGLRFSAHCMQAHRERSNATATAAHRIVFVKTRLLTTELYSDCLRVGKRRPLNTSFVRRFSLFKNTASRQQTRDIVKKIDHDVGECNAATIKDVHDLFI